MKTITYGVRDAGNDASGRHKTPRVATGLLPGASMSLYCCACRADVPARLTDGGEIYPHRADLADLPFWKCDACNNFVGCHHQTKNRTHPLGCIPSPEIKNARKENP